ncbi:hypothetical protein evm_012732 [Chilo suppressalis]|nr:hypothetical protein evm_012732 [Chilo suppressalis]
MVLQETWLQPNTNFNISNYFCLREDRTDSYGGVALLISDTVPFQHIPITNHSTDFSIIAASVQNKCFVSIYIPHPSSSIYDKVAAILSRLPKPILIMGDFNAQHRSWGSSSSSYYGARILDIVDKNNFCILNSGDPTRRTQPNEGISAPDLTISTPNLASFFSWSMLSSTFGSDHFPILISFPKTVLKSRPTRKHRINNDSDSWEKFRELVAQKVSSLFAVQLNDQTMCADAFALVLIEAADSTFLQKKWDGWKAFCSSLAPDISPSAIWTNIRRFRTAFREPAQKFINEEVADKFLDKLAPPFVSPDNTPLFKSIDNLSHDHGLNSPFSLTELKCVLSYVKDSAPGSDGIPYSFISHFSDDSLIYLLQVINSIMVNNKIHISWKTQELIPILKHNKPPADPNSYRPIALASVLSKIAEHLVKNRLEWLLESKALLASSQYGFRKVCNEAKFLGIILDSKLTGLSHCYYVSARCEKLLNILRCLSGVWWGAHPSTQKLIYNTIIRSILDYGTCFLEPCSALALSNEVADKLAKDSVNCGDVFPYKNLVNDLVLLPIVHLRISWEENWDTSSRIKGHNCSSSHLAKLGIGNNNICACGTGAEDLNHIFFECPLNDISLSFSFCIEKDKDILLSNLSLGLENHARIDTNVVKFKFRKFLREVYIKMKEQQRLLAYLVSVEKLAEEILSDRHEIIMLDKRRNQNREALRELTKSQQGKCWVTVGSVLIKNNLETTKSMLEADQKQLHVDINNLRSNLKVKVNNLRDLEMQPPVPGLMLVPMTPRETEGLSTAGLISIR